MPDKPFDALPPYQYQAATGGATFQPKPSAMKHVRAVVAAHRHAWPDIEIERVLDLGNHRRRYWRWRKGKWTTNTSLEPSPKDLERWANPTANEGDE